MKFRNNIGGRVFIAGLLALSSALAGQQEIDVNRPYDANGWPKPIPVSISGFTGEVDGVLKTDLLFMGIENVSPERAQYLISGSNASRVEGRVVARITKNQILAKAYTGGSLRSQTHALADDIALAITGKKGIAQTKIAFKGETGRGNGEIYIADYDGHNPQAVTHDQTIVAAPCWSRHSTLFYASYKLGAAKIFSHQLTSGARKLLTPFPGSNISPAVSPDGSRLAMILSKGGSPDLYVSDSDGGNLKQLTSTREAESSPCWSPDGQTICYVSRERGPASMYTVSASGGAPRRVITNGAPNPTEPDWSPDGRWIAFTSLTGGFQICIVRAQGGDAIVIAPGEDPSWAPNSRALIFCHGPDHSKKLSLLDVPTKQVKDIARVLESNSQSQPSWAK
jgi:TolB protein